MVAACRGASRHRAVLPHLRVCAATSSPPLRQASWLRICIARPISKSQSWHLRKIAPVARHKGSTNRQGNGCYAELLRSNADFLLAQRGKLLVRALLKRKHGDPWKKANGLL